jgi:metal-responsive CopG/Arc/MetJ family transcriptional regulator
MGLLETPRRGRPKKDAVMDTLAVRLPDDLVEQIDEYVRRLQTDLPGFTIARADAIRQLLAVGLRAENERLKE